MLALTAGLSLGVGLSPVSHGRQLSQIPIGKYAPNTNVLDHANIDLDQMTLEGAFGSSPYDFAAVKSAWQGAGFSKATATCVLAAGAASKVEKDDKVFYMGSDDVQKAGTATAELAVGGTTLTFKPEVVADNRDSRMKPGSMSVSAGSTTPGTAVGTCSSITYSGGRTLAGFSTGAKSKMYSTKAQGGGCPAKKAGTVYANGCPYTSYKPYFDYYCKSSTSSCNAKGDYVNQMVLAAADKTTVKLDNVNINFGTGTASEETYRKDFLKKISKFAGAWMYAIREFEDAIDDCALKDYTANQWSDGAVHAWDEGVAFYVGGQVKASDFYDAVTGEEQMPPNKYLAYTLGNKRCSNFKTCGRNGDKSAGEAYINFELWKEFGNGRDAILAGNCAGAVPIKNKAVQLMSVPLVQGSLRYAYKCRNGVSCSAKSLGELGSFVVSILPQVAACSAAHAATILAAANPAAYTCADSATCSGASNDFAKVKAAFEACYPDMGMTCKMIGGLYDSNKLEYYTGAEPCSDESTATASDTLTTGAIIGIAVGGGAALVLLLCLCFVVCKERSGKPLFTPLGAPSSKPAGGSKPPVSSSSASGA